MIVVGVDGSEESRDALRWALAESRLRDSRVRVVHAWHYPTFGGGYGYVVPEVADVRALETAASEALEKAVAEVKGDTGDVALERVVRQGPAAQVLIEESEQADLLVVGSRGHGGFAGMLLGSVSQHCAHHARCPLVIVRPSKDPARP